MELGWLTAEKDIPYFSFQVQEEGRLIFKPSYNYDKLKKEKCSVNTWRIHGVVLS